ILRPLTQLLADLRAAQRGLRVVAWWLAGGVALYGGSIAILGVAQWIGSDARAAFEWGHVGIAALWALTGVTAVRAGLRWSGLTITGASIALAAAFDTTQLAQTPRAWAYLAVALAALAVSFLDRGEEVAVTLLAAALVLAGVSAAWLLDGTALALVWAAETAVLAWAGSVTRRPRLSVAAFAWLGVTLVHVLAIDAR